MNKTDSKQETVNLFSISKYDDTRYYKVSDMTASELIDLANNSDKPFAALSDKGEKLSEAGYAELQQSDAFGFSVEFDFDQQKASVCTVNDGKGGVSEGSRTDANMTFETVELGPEKEKTLQKSASATDYNIDTARTYIVNGKENLEVTMTTPYFYNGEPVNGYAVVDCGSVDVNKRTYNTCELWQHGHNLEDVVGVNNGTATTVIVQDKDGHNVDYKNVLDEMGQFARDKSVCPHVMNYGEFASVYNNTHQKSKTYKSFEPYGFTVPTADEDRYNTYLEQTKSLMRSGMKYIGEVTKPEDVDHMLTTTPSFDQAYQEAFSAQHDGSELDMSEFDDTPSDAPRFD